MPTERMIWLGGAPDTPCPPLSSLVWKASIADCVPRSARALVARAPHRARYGRRPWTSRGVRAAVPVRGDVGWRAEQGGGHAFGEGVGLRPGASPGRDLLVVGVGAGASGQVSGVEHRAGFPVGQV